MRLAVILAIYFSFPIGAIAQQVSNENEQILAYCVKGLAQRDNAFIQARDLDAQLTKLKKDFEDYKAAHPATDKPSVSTPSK